MVGVSVGMEVGVAVGNGVAVGTNGVGVGIPNDVTVIDVFGSEGTLIYSALSVCGPNGAHVVDSPFASERITAEFTGSPIIVFV